MVQLVRDHRLAQDAEPEHARSTWQDRDFAFAQRTGAPIDSRADRRDWDQFLKDSGVRPARLHDALHTAATTLLLMGVPARVVMQTRPLQIGLTLGTYSHVVPSSPPTPPTRSPWHTGDSVPGPSNRIGGKATVTASNCNHDGTLILCPMQEARIVAGQTWCDCSGSRATASAKRPVAAGLGRRGLASGRLDRTRFSVHRIDDPATGFGDNGNGGGTAVSARPRAASQLKVTGPWKADGTDEG